jgi:hypothetical protein
MFVLKPFILRIRIGQSDIKMINYGIFDKLFGTNHRIQIFSFVQLTIGDLTYKVI